MRNRSAFLAWLGLLISVSSVQAQCVFTTTLYVGGQVNPAFGSGEGPFSVPVFYLDRAHPAATATAATRADFSTFGAPAIFSIQFLAVRPTGSGYVIADQTAQLAVSPPSGAAGAVTTFTLSLSPPLNFSRGDLLGVITTAQLAVTYADRAGGYGVRSAVPLPAPPAFDDGSFQRFVTRYSIAAAVQEQRCRDLNVPPAELLLPAVGDVVGAAHFVTRLDAAMHFPDVLPLTGPALVATLYDRVSNPGTVHIISSALNIDFASESFHSDSLAADLGISPPFFGPLILQFPITATDGRGGRSIFSTASATIVALNTCSGGETGTVIPAVGCSGIGRTIELHFHVPADHRVNLGIASAQLASCGVPVPATAVRVNGTLVQMPGQSIQLNNITGAGSPLPALVGVTDATVTVTVEDNASRIAAYVSILDNRSQDSVVVTGIVTD